jgi:hypothetical protein
MNLEKICRGDVNFPTSYCKIVSEDAGPIQLDQRMRRSIQSSQIFDSEAGGDVVLTIAH